MARKLKALTNKIHIYLHGRFPKQKMVNQPIHVTINEVTLQPALQIAFLQGEAILRLRFFKYLDEKHITDPIGQCNTWQLLIEDKRFIQQIAENSGLIDYFSFKTPSKTPISSLNESEGSLYQTLCFTVFCILLWDIHENDDAYCEQLINGLVIHFLPTLYPKQVKSTDIAHLKQSAVKSIAKRWHNKPEIKESFKIENDIVLFSLIAKLPQYAPVTLLEINGKRLKPTRLSAYQALLNGLESGSLALPSPTANMARKKDELKGIGELIP